MLFDTVGSKMPPCRILLCGLVPDLHKMIYQTKRSNECWIFFCVFRRLPFLLYFVYMPKRIHHHVPHDETSEIIFRIEGYDDIFSDFDVRPYSKRAISVDFLDEVKRASRDKYDDGVTLTICVPKKRHASREVTIKERLSSHFKRHYKLLLQEKRRVMTIGFAMVVMGIFSMIAATFILFKDPSENLLLSFFVVFLEPAAWFLLWEGMDLIIFHSKKRNVELDFYKKMSHTQGHICFKTC